MFRLITKLKRMGSMRAFHEVDETATYPTVRRRDRLAFDLRGNTRARADGRRLFIEIMGE